ncbi:MAG TPA: DNA alkylation repair protein [Candidatus Binataceae bacterium]|nr:DNA alkylation repair protein [Candidatus Binataceae bacterium]
MHAHHKVLLAGLEKHRRNRVHSQTNDSYLSSGHLYYDVSIPVLRTLAKVWLKENKGVSDSEFLAVLESLYRCKSYEEKILASILLSYHRTGRRTVGPKQLNTWLDNLVGWAEIDSLCLCSSSAARRNFTSEEILANWGEWERFVRGLSLDKNINKRRAALVFLTAPLRYSKDKRVAALGFEVVEVLKPERDIMITKAVSWILRSMVRHHKRAVANYIKETRDSLPAIAVRETTRKIATGQK